MRIGILGSGRMGGKLGTIWAREGHSVIFSYSRSNATLDALARAAGPNARAGSASEATREADVILLAVHWSRIDDVLTWAGDLRGKLVLSCCMPMNAEDTQLVHAGTTSGAEELARKIPGARVVSAFHTVPSEVLFDVHAKRGDERPSLLVHGDDEDGKRIVSGLVRDAGFEPVDAGPLRIARYSEPFSLLIAQLAYETEEGPRLAYRFERFSG